ncbi:hypothetical protein ABNF65_19160 [Paenibacillus larvae]
MDSLEKYFPLIAAFLICIGAIFNYMTARLNYKAAKRKPAPWSRRNRRVKRKR